MSSLWLVKKSSNHKLQTYFWEFKSTTRSVWSIQIARRGANNIHLINVIRPRTNQELDRDRAHFRRHVSGLTIVSCLLLCDVACLVNFSFFRSILICLRIPQSAPCDPDLVRRIFKPAFRPTSHFRWVTKPYILTFHDVWFIRLGEGVEVIHPVRSTFCMSSEVF